MSAMLHHFVLPTGRNVQIAFSGGRTSGYMLWHLIEANGGIPPNAVILFMNTGREMPESLDFVQECAARWGVTVIWLEYVPRRPMRADEYDLVRAAFGEEYAQRFADWWARSWNEAGFQIVSHNSAARDGEPLLALVMQRKFLPNQASRFCTTETKIRTGKRYLRSIGWDYWTTCVGMRHDEQRRIKPEGVLLKDRWTVWQPLNHAKVSKRDVQRWWNAQPFDLRLPNVNGSCWLGNCDGCFLKSEANVAALAREYPERHAWWENMETMVQMLWPRLTRKEKLRRILTTDPDLSAAIRDGWGRPVPPSVLDSIVNAPRSAGQWSKRYSRAELRDFMERQDDAFDVADGQLCQADDGECTG